MTNTTKRVLIIGRSAPVLLDAVSILRERGYAANATNQVARVLDDYDMREVDLVIFGGMVPPQAKEALQAEIRDLNPNVSFIQGLGGIAALLAAQVKEFFDGTTPGVKYDADNRVVRVTHTSTARVVVEGLWATFEPFPEPVPHSAIIADGVLAPGEHEIAIPDEVPEQGSYITVRVAERVSAFQIGEPPQSIKRLATTQSAPIPEPVATQLPWQ